VKPVRPKLHENAHLVTFGRSQPELYFALPASVDDDGCVMTEWELSAEDLARVLDGGRVRLWLMHTGVNKGAKLTPIRLETIERG
jgi:hypothetical protein